MLNLPGGGGPGGGGPGGGGGGGPAAALAARRRRRRQRCGGAASALRLITHSGSGCRAWPLKVVRRTQKIWQASRVSTGACRLWLTFSCSFVTKSVVIELAHHGRHAVVVEEQMEVGTRVGKDRAKQSRRLHPRSIRTGSSPRVKSMRNTFHRNLPRGLSTAAAQPRESGPPRVQSSTQGGVSIQSKPRPCRTRAAAGAGFVSVRGMALCSEFDRIATPPPPAPAPAPAARPTRRSGPSCGRRAETRLTQRRLHAVAHVVACPRLRRLSTATVARSIALARMAGSKASTKGGIQGIFTPGPQKTHRGRASGIQDRPSGHAGWVEEAATMPRWTPP